ncbi:hypothetical protein V866_006786 [Kwoniella sp. B9012]
MRLLVLILILIFSALNVYTIPIPSPLDDTRRSQLQGLSLLDKRDSAEISQNGGDIVWTRSDHQDRASNGGIFAYGRTNFYGSMGSAQLNLPEEGTRVKGNSELDDRDDAVETNVRRGFITVDVIPEDTGKSEKLRCINIQILIVVSDQDQTPAFDARRRSKKGSCLTCAKGDAGPVVEVQNQTPAFDVRSERNSRVSFVRDTTESEVLRFLRQSLPDPVEAQGFDCSGRKRNPDVDSEDDTILWISSSQHDWDKRSSDKQKRMERANAKNTDQTDGDIVWDGDSLDSVPDCDWDKRGGHFSGESTEWGKRDSEPADGGVTGQRRDVE